MSVEEKEKIVERKVVQKEGGKDEAGKLAHCVSLIKANLSQLNNKLEIMRDQINSNQKLGNVGKKNAFLKPIYCFYCKKYQDKTVHFCEKEDCYIQYDHYNKMVMRADSQTATETGKRCFYDVYE